MSSYSRRALWLWTMATAVSLASIGQAQSVEELDAHDVRFATRPADGTPPAELYRLGEALTPPDPRDAESIVEGFLSAPALRRPGAGPPEYATVSRSSSADGSIERVVMQTRFGGIPVYEGDVIAHLDPAGRLLRLHRGRLPRPPRGLELTLEPAQAAAVALRALDPDQPRQAAWEILSASSEPSRPTVLRHPDLREPVRASLVWFPLGDEARPAWRLYLEPYEMAVDAVDGRILFSFNLAREATPQGSVLRAPQTPHPDAGAPAVQALSGWPAQAGGACPAGVYPAPGAGGPAAGGCWTDGSGTFGNNADVCFDLNGDEVCDGRAAVVNGSLVFPFSDSYKLTNDPAPDRAFALVNAFYWTNALHDWLYGLGFKEPDGNFQAVNFGRGGGTGDAVRVDIHDGATPSNATFLTPPDGIAPRLNVGLYPGVRRDAALDGDILTHEYAHGVTSRLVGGPLNAASLYLLQSAGLSEGWSDAFAFAFTGEPRIGEYSSTNASTGVRTVRYDQSGLTFGQVGVRRVTLLPPSNQLAGLPESHADGEVWASALWDVRQAVGAEAFPRLLIEALKMTPSRPSFLDARDALLQAAEAMALGGERACAVWAAFAARGMGASAALNAVASGEAADTAVSVYEAFDRPTYCGGAPPAAGAALLSEGAEAASGWTATGLWHRSTRRAATGGYSWRFGRADAADYQTGQREAGELVSPPIDLTGAAGATVEWQQVLRNEGFWRRYYLGGVYGPYLNLDSGRLWVSADGGAWQAVTHLAHPTPGEGFVRHRVNLSRFAGRTIRLRFEFDTFTSANNNYEGWYLDDIQVLPVLAEAPRLSVQPAALTLQGVAGTPVAPAALEIRNSGGGTLSWTAAVTAGAGWLQASPATGGAPGQVTVTATGSTPGAYAGVVRVSAGAAGTTEVPVTLTLAAPPEPTGVLAEWSFEGGGPGLTIEGARGLAQRLNGWTEGLSTGAPLEVPDRFTVRAWVRLSEAPTKPGLLVSAFGGTSFKGWYLGVAPGPRAVWMAAQPPDSAPWLLSQATLQSGRWHMLTATYDRGTNEARLYVDGVLDRVARFPGLEPDVSHAVTLGKASWTENYFLRGALDEARVERGVRTAEEIAADYASFSPPAPIVNLATPALWSFPAADRGADSSGNNRRAAALSGLSIPGVANEALRLDGAADAALAVNHEQLNPDDFTALFWARLNALPASSNGGVMAGDLGATSGWEVGVRADGRPYATFGGAPGPETVTAPQPFGLGVWRRVALVHRAWSKQAQLYLDGKLAAQSVLAAGMKPRADGQFTVGRAAGSATRFTRFDVDELRIEARPWSAAELAADAASWTPPAAQPEPTPAPGSLVARWELDETGVGAGVALVDGVGGRNATTAADRTRPMAGLSGAARRFEGWPDGASADADAALLTQSFSYSAWVRIDETPQSWGVLFSTYDGDVGGWYVGVYKDARVILCVTGPPASRPWLLSSKGLTLGRWHHVEATFDGPSRRGLIYVDGERAGSAVFGAWAPASGVRPTFGKASWGATGWLKHAADRVKLYDYERSAEEVAADFAELDAARRPAPLGRWELDETTAEAGAAFRDAGPGGRDGVLAGSGGVPEAGLFGGARRFQGRPDVGLLPADPAWNAPAFTWSAWVKPNALPGSWGTLFSTYDGDYRGWYVGLHGSGRVIVCVAGRPASSPWLLSGSALTPGRWTHVAVTFDGVSRRAAVYVDGSLDATAVFPAYTPSSGVAPTAARASWTDSYYLDVTLDRMRLEPMEMSVQQVLQMVME
ncbi:MAG: hypothetical protein GC160_20560 [Acidobacteria bacterium]|nr:hypothetical protein [Acidobacteriota bacterium]